MLDRYTVWSRYGTSACPDDRPLVHVSGGGLAWAPRASWNVRDIARFDTRELAAGAASEFGPFRPGATAPSVTPYPFYAYELQPA